MSDDDDVLRAVAAILARAPEGPVSLDLVEEELARAIQREVTQEEVDRTLTAIELAGRRFDDADAALGRDKLVAIGQAAVALRRALGRTPTVAELAIRAGVTRAEALRGLVVVRFAGRSS